jgi:protocatechuate 3,4-dioxygenase beta subunit
MVMRSRALTLFIAAILGTAAANAQRQTVCHEQEPTASTVRIANEEEPGDRMVVSGRVLRGQERVPVAGAKVLAFHTDAKGYYSPGGMDERNARLCGVLSTDEEGRYRIETIRPARYATGGPPAHIHFEVTAPGETRRRYTLNFEGDPDLGGALAGESWDRIRPVTRSDDGILSVERDFWLR